MWDDVLLVVAVLVMLGLKGLALYVGWNFDDWMAKLRELDNPPKSRNNLTNH